MRRGKRILAMVLSISMIMGHMSGNGISLVKAEEWETTVSGESIWSVSEDAVTEISQNDTGSMGEDETIETVSGVEEVKQEETSREWVMVAPIEPEIMEGLGSLEDINLDLQIAGNWFGALLGDSTPSASYRDQLDGVSQTVYDTLLAAYSDGPVSTTTEIPLSEEEMLSFIDQEIAIVDGYARFPDEVLTAISAYVSDSIAPAMLALIYDHPELCWMINAKYIQGYGLANTSYSVPNGAETIRGDIVVNKLTFRLYDIYSEYSAANMSQSIINAKAAIDAGLSESATLYDTVKAIHDYVCRIVDYENTEANYGLHAYQTPYSVFYDMDGDGITETVCAGYSKAFKLICEQYNIPCILVSGQGINTSGHSEAHMWNYVKMENNRWYAVDCTWDDQNTIFYDFFLVGSETVATNFAGHTFGYSHEPSGAWSSSASIIFRYPALNAAKYNPESVEPEEEVFDDNGFGNQGGFQEPLQDEEGYYLIANGGNLYWFSDHVTHNIEDGAISKARLVNDIHVNPGFTFHEDGTFDVDENATSNEPRQWAPIGIYTNGKDGNYRFNGIFDGAGYCIEGLYSTDSAKTYGGLFGICASVDDSQIVEIKNVTITNSYLEAKTYAGGICGEMECGVIENCHNDAYVVGHNTRIGGICAYLLNGTIRNCYNTGSVRGIVNTAGVSRIGGICGHIDSTLNVVENCYSVGTVSGTNESTGMLAIGNIYGVAYAGSRVTNCYYLNEMATSVDTANTALKAKSQADFARGQVAYLLNGDQSTITFKQTLSGENAMTYPAFLGQRVYRVNCVEGTAYRNLEEDYAAHSYDEEGVCTRCLEEAKVSVGENGNVQYFPALYEALEYADTAEAGEASQPVYVKLLADVSLSENVSILNNHIIIDMNDKTVTNIGSGDIVLTISNRKELDITNSNTEFHGTIGDKIELLADGGSLSLERVHANAVRGTQQSDTRIEIVSGVYGSLGVYGGCTLTGGQYDEITVLDEDTCTLTDFITSHYVYYDTVLDQWIKSVDLEGITQLQNVSVKPVPIEIADITQQLPTLVIGYTESPDIVVNVNIVTPKEEKEVSYQWYKDQAVISGADTSTYTVETGLMVGTYEYYCVVEYDGYCVESPSIVLEVEKTDCPAEYAPGSISQNDELSDNTLTFTGVEGVVYEYSMDGGETWHNITLIDGVGKIPVGNVYVEAGGIWLRVKETDTRKSGDIITNEAAFTMTIEGSVSLHGNAVYGQTLSANVVGVAEEIALNYAFFEEDTQTPIQSGTENTYTLAKDNIGKKIYVRVSPIESQKYTGELISAQTEIVEKADCPAGNVPANVTVNDKPNSDTCSFTGISGVAYEYSLNQGETFHNVTVTNGKGNIAVGNVAIGVGDLWIRAKETEIYKASAIMKNQEAFTAAPVLTGNVTLSGRTRYKQVLTANVTGVDSSVSLMYEFRESEEDTLLQRSNRNTYILKQTDIGKQIYVKVVPAADSDYIGELVSEATEVVLSEDALLIEITQQTMEVPSLVWGYTEAPELEVTVNILISKIGQSVRYQWYQDGTLIPGATERTYQVETGLAVGEYIYECEITYDDCTINSSQIAVVVDRKDCPVEYTPILKMQNDQLGADYLTFTGSAGIAYEYSMDGGESWEDIVLSETLGTINVGNRYVAAGQIQVRAKQTATYNASQYISNEIVFTFTIEGSVEILGNAEYGVLLRASVTGVADDIPLKYAFYEEGNDTALQESEKNTYTITETSIGRRIYVKVTPVEEQFYTGELTSLPTMVIQKAEYPEEYAPKDVTVNNNPRVDTCTFTATEGVIYEYSLDEGATWTDCVVTDDVGVIPIGNRNVSVEALWIRAKESVAYKSGTIVKNSEPFTTAILLQGTVDISGTAKFRETLTATVSGIGADIPLIFEFMEADNHTVLQSSEKSTYVIGGAAVGKQVYVKVLPGEETDYVGEIVSGRTETVTKAESLPTVYIEKEYLCTEEEADEEPFIGLGACFSTATDQGAIIYGEPRISDPGNVLKQAYISDGRLIYSINRKGDFGVVATITIPVTTENYQDSYIFVKITMTAPDEIWYRDIEPQIYTGKSIKPEVEIYNHETRLVQGTDYSVSYKNSVNASTAASGGALPSVIVKGKGNFSKSLTLHYDILQKDIHAVDVIKETAAVKYNGKNQQVVPHLVYNGKTLKLGKDFSYSFEDAQCIEPGVYKIQIKGMGNFTGTTTTTMTILDGSKCIQKAKVEKIPKKQYLFGKEVVLTEKDLKVTLGGIPLTWGTDYKVSYVDNIKPGKATAIITGTNGYAGTKRVHFTIERSPQLLSYDMIQNQSDISSVLFLKGGSKPVPVLTTEWESLVEGKDYTVSYKNYKVITNSASIVIRGKGNYKGTLIYNYSIVEKTLDNVESPITMRVPDVVYSTKPGKWMSKPVLTDADGYVLKSGKDYGSISYTLPDGKALSPSDVVPQGTEIVVTVSGVNGYKGTLSASYTIAAVSFKKASISIYTQQYTGEAILLEKEDFRKVSIGGKLLSYGVDYVIVPGSYKRNTKKGTATVVIKGIGQYAGEKTAKFKISAKGLY